MQVPIAARSTFALGALLCAGLAVGSPSGVKAEQPSSFRFAFAPEPGVTWKVSVQDEQWQDFKGMRDPHHQITETEFRQRWERNADQQWELVQVSRDVAMTINDELVVNPIFDVIVGHEVRVQMDAEGRAVSATGFRELMRRYERELDPGLYQRIRENMSVDGMAAAEMDKRNQSMKLLAGREASTGQRWGLLDIVAFQGTLTPVTGVVSIEGWSVVDGREGVKVVYRFDSRGAAYAAAEADLDEVISLRDEGQQIPNSNIDAQGSFTWVVEPATGQMLYETAEQTILVPLGVEATAAKAEFKSSHVSRWTRMEDGSR